MQNFYKIVSIGLLVAFVAAMLPVSFTPLKTQKAEAIPTIDAGAIAGILANLVQEILEVAWEAAVAILQKQILDMIVDQIIQWIQGGGEPKFISDWSGFLQDAGNKAAGKFIEGIADGVLCEPFNLNIQLQLRNKSFTDTITCTLDDVVGNIENFYDDFRSGGWIGYTTSLEPQNNFFGASLIAVSGLEKVRAAAEKAAELEGVTGGGYIGTKKCDKEGNCTITTPGQTIAGLVDKSLGADIDLIVNSQDIGPYIAAIADAAINRLIAEGVGGLQNLTTKKAPDDGFIKPGAGNCKGLKGDALDACENYQESSGNQFNESKSIFIAEIDKTFKPRRETQDAQINAISNLNQYKSNLEFLLAEFEKAICVNKNAFIKEINDELGYVAQKSDELQKDKSENDLIVKELEEIRSEINNAEINEWNKLTTSYRKFKDDGRFKEEEANKAKQKAEKDNGEIDIRKFNNSKKFQQNLTKCS